MRQHAHQQDEQQRQDGAKTWNAAPEQVLGLPRHRQQGHALVHRADDQIEHPQRDAERHQHEQPGQEPGLEGGGFLGNHGFGHEGQALALPPAGAEGVEDVDVDDDEADEPDESPPEAAGADAAAPPVAAGALAPLLPPLPPRKSVTYQPEPLSWKPAAVSCFLKDPAAPQDGQSVSGASLIFCSTSRPWPQASQR
ncbi:hypothetical protein D3C81_1414660 [compost metagenome]